VGDYTIDKLLTLIPTFDFGIFVFAADDTVDSRGQRLLVARDNVVLELGLFMERLGRKHTLLVVQDINLHLPSDLQGLTVARFKLPPEFSPPSEKKLAKVPPKVLSEALAPACDEIRDAIFEGSEPQKIPDVLSGGMVYLLRHIETRGYSSLALAPALVHFQTKKKIADLPDSEQKGWRKATQYACQCLQALGLVSVYDGGSHFRITEQGRRLLSSESLKETFESELKMKRVRIVPSRI
jgi:ribosomal protein S19E (S16A)